MSRTWQHLLLVTIASGTVFFLNLGVPDLWDEDEPKNAACAREMLERNDWVVPMFNYELRTAKPVFLYWLIMSAYSVFGITEFSARVWSAILGVGTCLLTYGIGRRLYSSKVGLWAALILPASLMFCVASRAVTPDAPLIFFSTLALAIFVWGLPIGRTNSLEFSSSHRSSNLDSIQHWKLLRACVPQRYSTYVLLYAAMGLAVLAKGPVGVVLPTLILMAYVWWSGRSLSAVDAPDSPGTSTGRAVSSWWTYIRHLLVELHPVRIFRVGWVLRPLTALFVTGAVALPWYIWVGWRTDGQWIEGFLGKHNVSRFVQPLEGHSGPIFYYLIAVLIGFFPGSVLLPLAIFDGLKRVRSNPEKHSADAFCLCWAIVYIGFFSLASTKLPSYVLSAFPALALITSSWLNRWLEEPSITPKWLVRGGFVNLVIVGAAFLIAAPLAVWKFVPGLWFLGWTGCILIAGGIVSLTCFERGKYTRAAASFAAFSLVFTAALFGIVAVQVNPLQTSSHLLGEIRDTSTNPQIATFDYFEPSLAFYAGRPVRRLKTLEQSVEFLQGSNDAFLLTRDKHQESIRKKLLSQVTELSRRPRFLKSGSVLVFTCNSELIARNTPRSTPTIRDQTSLADRTESATGVQRISGATSNTATR